MIPYTSTDNYGNDRFKLQTENVYDRKNIVESLQKAFSLMETRQY